MKIALLAGSLCYSLQTIRTLHPCFPATEKKVDDLVLIVHWKGDVDVEGVKQASMVFGSWPGMRPLALYLGGVSLNRACSCA